jgi:hypothetical protein
MPADGAILARSESDSITFGHGLTDEELGWLKAAIEQVLAAGVRRPGTEIRWWTMSSGSAEGDRPRGTLRVTVPVSVQ